MGSDETHFNISLTVRDKVTRQCPQTTIFEEKGEPKRIRAEVPPLTSLMPITARPNRLTANYMARNCRLYVTLFCFSVFVCFCVFDSNTVSYFMPKGMGNTRF